MAYPKKIKNFYAFMDGVSYAGKVVEGKLPELKLKTQDYRGAGMFGAVEIVMGQEKMEAELTLAEWAPEFFKTWGSRNRITLRPAAQSEDSFEAEGFVFVLGGRVRDLNPDTLKPAEDANLKIGMAVDYLKVEHEGETLIEIDVENNIQIVGGVDQMADMRRAMGG